ncbi:PAS domain S-box protein [Geoglobus acetivorans]|uniref:histidine kinase n=1 Tax=Geoglobus acetivorans TaxID=565033 RepID=A0ABZ3H241_GEOAI|nr:PAS domain S-box protein [Geoglobus acetivorans]
MDCDKFDEKFWKTIVNKSLAGIYIHDTDFKLIYVNEIVERATKFTKEELMKKSLYDLVHPDDLSLIKSEVLKVFNGEATNYECRYIRKDGKVRWVWGYVLPIECDDEILALGNWIDITRKKHLENRLKENNELFRVLVDDSPNPAYILQDDKVAYVNQSLLNLTGYTREELSKIHPLELVHPEDREMVERRYRERLEGKRGVETYSWRILTKDGNVYWVTGRPSRINYRGKPAVASILVDTTDLHRLTEMLKKKNEYLALVNKILRHDILNDITVIRAAFELGEEKLKESALKKLDRIESLIKESKAIEEAIGETYTINISDYIREITKGYEDLADIQYSLTNVFVKANESIKSVIDNLLRNAVMHSNSDDIKITIETFVNGRYGVFRIIDNGKGIPDEIKDKIFEEGFSTVGGTGIGLFIAKKVVELLGGEIKVYDNTPSGAIFEVRLKRY